MEWLKNLFGGKQIEPQDIPEVEDPALTAVKASIAAAHKVHDALLIEIEHEKGATQRIRDTANEQAQSIVGSARAELQRLHEEIAAKRAELNALNGG